MGHTPETIAKMSLDNGMTVMREKYPDMFIGSSGDWTRRCLSYWETLQGHDARTLTIVCKRIAGPEYYPDQFPTAGQMARVARDIKRELRDSVSTSQPKPQHASEAPRRLADDNVFEQIAQAWEQESQRLGIGKWDTPPAEIARRRIADLREIWRAYSHVMPIPSPDPNKPKPYQPNIDKAKRLAGEGLGPPAPPPPSPVALDIKVDKAEPPATDAKLPATGCPV